MAKTSFWDHPLEKLEEALNLKKQIHALQERLSSMFGSDENEEPKRRPGFPPVEEKAGQTGKRGRKPFSAETRAKMAAAQQARRAKKKAPGVASPTDDSTKKTKSAKPGRKGKRTMSPEARARIAAAQRARWAKQKAA